MPKILLADDDEDLVEVLGERLKASGYEIITAYEGLAAYEAARQHKPDLIILDWKMPTGKGSAVLDMLAERNDTKNIPVIILSGAEEAGMDDTLRIFGVKSFIKKPYDSEKLLAAVKAVLS